MFFKKTDFLIIASIAAFCAVFYFVYAKLAGNVPVRAEIYYYSQLVETVNLKDEAKRIFSIPQNENVIFEVSNGFIRFIQSDCPDKVCIKSGGLSKAGQSAACLPNGIIIKIVSQMKGGRQPDAITGN